MAFNFDKCKVCPSRFKVKKINKPYIGMYMGKPVFHWHYLCPRCKHVHTVRYWNEHVNPYYDKTIDLKMEIWWHSRDKEKVEQLKTEYENAWDEMDNAYENMLNQIEKIKRL